MSASAVIGVVGNDVPRLLPLAAAAVPMRLTGSWDGPVDPAAQELLGASDLETVRILTELRAGAVHVDALVVCNDTQAHLRLFYVLRVTAPHLPLQLLDLPRADSAPARAFARGRLMRLLEFCEQVSGCRASAADFAAAAEAERTLGAAIDRLRRARRSDPPDCTGATAIDALLQAGRLPPEEAVAVVDAACAPVERDAASPPRRRVHLTGSNHPDPSVYRTLEEHDLVIVSEDHDTGDGARIGVADGTDTDVDAIIDALVGAHFSRTGGSATALSAERASETVRQAVEAGAEAVGAFIRELDDAPRWDLADQDRALADVGMTLQVRTGVGADPLPAAAELAAALRGRGDR
ncbi:MAG TPA: 2-hydroxyacyl-CoA dehydratase family protein [Microbacterium sp.]|nr:2-hydroxyacyl-CoA dehydratase family protein [Microbacterium sp.]